MLFQTILFYIDRGVHYSVFRKNVASFLSALIVALSELYIKKLTKPNCAHLYKLNKQGCVPIAQVQFMWVRKQGGRHLHQLWFRHSKIC
jgi:hypothetical protein